VLFLESNGSTVFCNCFSPTGSFGVILRDILQIGLKCRRNRFLCRKDRNTIFFFWNIQLFLMLELGVSEKVGKEENMFRYVFTVFEKLRLDNGFEQRTHRLSKVLNVTMIILI
jgi:hypothetical protein